MSRGEGDGMERYQASREPMIRAVREALDRHEHEHADNDGRAVAVVLAVEPLAADRLRGAVDAERQRIAALVRLKGIKAGGDARLTELADYIAAGGR